MKRLQTAIPVDWQADYCKDLILPLRDTNKLSKFLLDLIKAYYEEEEMQAIFALYVERNDPFYAIKKQIDEAQENHQRTVMTTQMMRTHVDASESEIKAAIESEVSPDVPAVESRLGAIEQALPELTSQLGQVLALLQQGGVSFPVAPAAASVEHVVPVSAPAIAAMPPAPPASVVAADSASFALVDPVRDSAGVSAVQPVSGVGEDAPFVPVVPPAAPPVVPSAAPPVAAAPSEPVRVEEPVVAAAPPVREAIPFAAQAGEAPVGEPEVKKKPRGFDTLKNSAGK